MILGLETLRGLAALVVAFFHYPGGSILWIPKGFMAVYLFFSLSGFVIALNYFNKINNLRSLVSFQKKRFFRLYPIHIFVLILVLLIQCLKFVAIELGLPAGQEAFGGHPSTGSWYTLRDFVLHVFLLQAVLEYGYFLSWNSAAWTISTEFYTYLLFAILVLISFRKSYIFITLSVIYLIFSKEIFQFINSIFYIFTPQFEHCILFFLSGSLMFFIYERIKYRFNDYIFYIFLIPCLYFKDYLPNHILFSIIILLVALLKKSSISNIILSYKPLVYLGTISYSFYMIHQVVLYLFIQVLKIFSLGVSFSDGLSSGGTGSILFDTIITISYTSISIVIAILMNKFIEAKYRIR
jgi:peptidoglycan/LPS O-acetylase OafA/YrhL